LKKAHSKDGFDRWYGEDARLLHAAACPAAEKGSPVEIDTDRENLSETSDPLSTGYADGDLEVGLLLDAWQAENE